MDTSPPEEHDPQLTRRYWKRMLKLTEAQATHLTRPLMAQLVRCKDDEARRIIINARMAGHEWKSKSAPRER